jgi:hypothetical protein
MSDNITLKDILEAIKNLTEEERKILEHELVIMRLGKEFSFISHKFQEKKASKNEEENQNGIFRSGI